MKWCGGWDLLKLPLNDVDGEYKEKLSIISNC